MSKIIKYRAWAEDKMIYPTRISLAGDVVYAYDADEDYEFQLEPDMLMLFTGLKDKNGTEIFEGDVLRQNHRLYEVHWHTAGLGLNMLYAEDEGPHIHSSRVPLRDWNWCVTINQERQPNWRELPKDQREYIWGINIKGEPFEPCEVIGNIHQNPDYLA